MKIAFYNIYCSHCEPSMFVIVPAEKVLVSVDLRTDEYVFSATCPKCGMEIHNRRRAFK